MYRCEPGLFDWKNYWLSQQENFVWDWRQELELYTCSTLFRVLNSQKVKKSFYDADSVRDGECILYCPDICVFVADSQSFRVISEKERYYVDTISCVSPQMHLHESFETLITKLKKCIRRVFVAAAVHGVKALVLGAFGCEKAQNPPEIVARAFREVMKDYLYYFQYIEFAIDCGNGSSTNYDVFFNEFSSYMQRELDPPGDFDNEFSDLQYYVDI